ncbi:MAG: DNA-directed RNA polymerase, subunit E'' [Candidatus Marsarchaeota archaeon]|nr:DNA-directed RNA polymerase, subunit E'' [Candidatus Marsarchaeota archaeon]
MVEKACKKCRVVIAQGEVCPICGSTNLTTRWNGYIKILNTEKSEIAKKLDLKVNGTYALNISE